jgi:hypothetical protein
MATLEPRAPDQAPAVRRCRLSTASLVAMAVAAVTAVAVAFAVTLVGRPDSSRNVLSGHKVQPATTVPATSPPTADTSPTTVAARPVVADPVSVGGIYPDADAYSRNGASSYAEPKTAARAFARDYVGMKTPLLGPFRTTGAGTGQMVLRADTRVAISTTLTLAQVGQGGPWTVTRAAAPTIRIDAPRRNDVLTSPAHLTGAAHAFEGAVHVEVRQDGMRAGSALGTGSVVGGGDEMRPFDGTVAFRPPSTPAGALLLTERSGMDGAPLVATTVRVRFSRSPAVTGPPTTASRLGPDSTVRFDGLGPVVLGMSEAQVRKAAGVELDRASTSACATLTPHGALSGLAIIAADSPTVNLVSIGSGPTATDNGVRVGSTEDDVLRAYGAAAEVLLPDQPEHRVVVRSTDAPLSIVFQIRERRVISYRAGARSIAEADEICA